MMKMVLGGWLMGTALAFACSPAIADGNHKGSFVRETVQISDHQMFGSGMEVDGATTLIRDYRNKVIRANVTTNALEPDFAYSIWWVVFNNPEYCATPYACASSDFEINGGDPRIKVSVFYGGGMLADGGGSTNTVMTLVPGKTKRELFAQSRNWGLRNIRKAEIHVVLRSHGLAGIAGPVSKQIGTGNEACPESGCANKFFSIHLSAKN